MILIDEKSDYLYYASEEMQIIKFNLKTFNIIHTKWNTNKPQSLYTACLRIT